MNATSCNDELAYDSMDRYRTKVENVLAGRAPSMAEEVLERFFDHVITQFEQGADASECASAWLHGAGRAF